MAVFLGALLLLASCGGTPVGDLSAGDCFNDPDIDVVTDIDLVDCSEAHDNEVYAEAMMADTTYPGADAIDDFAVDACRAAFEPYVGSAYEDSPLDYFYLSPTEEGWGGGDRGVLCVLYSKDLAELEGTQRAGN